MATVPPLPPGFTLDSQQGSIPPLPAGFALDQPARQNQFAGDDLLSDEAMGRLAAGEQTTVTPSPAPSPFRGIRQYGQRVNDAVGAFSDAKPAGIVGVGETALSLLTGALSPVVGTAEHLALGTPIEQAVDNATYRPRTESSRAQLGMLGALMSPITESGTDIALGPLVATNSRVIAQSPVKIARDAYRARRAGNAVPDKPVGVDTPVVGGKEVPVAKAGSPRAAGLEQVPEADPVQSARSAGYKLKPSESGGKVGGVVEGLTGSAKLETSLVKKNQKNTDRLAREEFGLPDGPVTRDRIRKLRDPHNAVYEEVKRLGNVAVDDAFRTEVSGVGRTPGKSFTKDTNAEVESLKAAYVDEASFLAPDAVLKVRELRYKSGKNIGSNDPAKQELGYAQRKIADAIDAQMERHAESLGQTDLVARYRHARQELAKLHNLEIAARGGEVDAAILGKMLERGIPLSGNLRKIAETANNFPNVMRPGRKVKGNTPVNMAETLVGVGGAAALGNPLVLGALAVRPAARAILSSKPYQNSLARKAAPQSATKNALRTEEKRNALLEF